MKNWQGKRVIIIGAARQGTALARYLASKGASVVINDQRPAEQLQMVKQSLDTDPASEAISWVFGEHPLSLLEGADLICPSGGVPLTLPLVVEALWRGIPLSNDSQIFLETAPCRVIGITGSAGKTTTTSLVGLMAQNSVKAPQIAWVGGNIGNPLIDDVDKMQPSDLAVMELSSFQLEIMTRSPHIAAVLNITPNHLDRHKTMEDYTAAKAHILLHQSGDPGDFDCAVILGHEDEGAWNLRSLTTSPVWTFGHQQVEGFPGTYLVGDMLCYFDGEKQAELMPRKSINLRGDHNLLNILAACAIAAAAGIPAEAMRSAVRDFYGVAHRLEFVREWGGAAWYNDSIATAPERTMAALRSFTEPIVLLAGGRDKNLPWGDFVRLVSERVDHLVLFGEAVEKIQAAVGNPQPGQRPFTIACCKKLFDAVQAAAKVVEPGDVVLLSPGGTSFDEFRDFEARGEAYRQWVLEL